MMQPPPPVPPILAAIQNGNTVQIPLPSREHQPAPSHLIEAIRTELKKIVDDPKLENRLGELGRLANQADDLVACVRAPEAVMLGEHKNFGMYSGGGVVPGVMPNNAETYGAQMMRQIIAALQEFQKANKETPERLAEAIAVARREGMTDLAAELEQRLVGKPLDGDRPINEPPSVEDYLRKADEDGQKPPQPIVGSGG